VDTKPFLDFDMLDTLALRGVDPLLLNINDPGGAQHLCTDMTAIS
jgi:hypothetical protein